MSHGKYSEIPASACNLVVGAFELGDNGEGAKSAPVRLVARSGQPIEHWFWGRVVHDLEGMQLHKSRLPIDYAHDVKEVIGYLNKFDVEDGDLVTSGALVPFKDTDRATEIVHKMAAGVPYEASINFGGDGIKVQDVPEGTVAEVNGYTFDGPGCIVREWPLRGVAVCPYGADMNTESAGAFSNKQVFSASVVSEPEATTEEGSEMSESVEVEAPVEAPEVEQEEAQEVEDTVETEEAEEPTVELTEDPVEADAPVEAPAELSRDDFLKITDQFGAEIAAQTVRDGGSYETALKLHADALTEENATLKTQVAELSAGRDGAPAPVVDASEAKPLFKSGK
jgi:hypothetical protein